MRPLRGDPIWIECKYAKGILKVPPKTGQNINSGVLKMNARMIIIDVKLSPFPDERKEELE
jgi:hypothetical protein